MLGSTEEIWKDIVNYEGLYQISNYGNVRSLNRITEVKRGNQSYTCSYKGRLIKPKLSTDGYCFVNSCKKGKQKPLYYHRLVAEHFIENHREVTSVNHIDGNKLNNHYSNLEWCTSQENTRHAFETGLIIPKYGIENLKVTTKILVYKDGVLIYECYGQKELKDKGFTPQGVNAVLVGRQNSHRGCIFERVSIKVE